MSEDPTKSVEESADQDARELEVDPSTAEDDGDRNPGVEVETPVTGGGDDPTAEAEEVDEAEESHERDLDALQEEFDSLHDRHLRLAADFENYRRRAETEMRRSWIRAQADLIHRLLDALDDLQRVTDVELDATSVEALLEGVHLVERKLGQALRDAGAEVVDPAGEEFDPNTMEAVMRVPAESEEEDDEVAQVFQKGYTFKGHLVRPARVSVKKHE